MFKKTRGDEFEGSKEKKNLAAANEFRYIREYRVRIDKKDRILMTWRKFPSGNWLLIEEAGDL